VAAPAPGPQEAPAAGADALEAVKAPG
jgi:hypothetical protein